MQNTFTYIIVGGGLAGASAIEGIRARDRSASIALFAKENWLPYDRPPLSKGLWSGKSTIGDIPVHDEAFYRSNNVEIFLKNEITRIDPSKHQVIDRRGRVFSYGKLLLATGGSPRALPFGQDALRYFRTVDDYIALKEESARSEEFIMIGGGFIGAELTAALTMNGKKVTMVFPEKTILERVLPGDLASFVTDYYRSKRVTLLTDDLPVNAERKNNKLIVTTKNGRSLSADVAIAAVGLNLHVELAEGAGLKVNNGVVVNSHLQTSDPDIYAAGDIANFPAKLLGRNIRIEHWNNALEQGKHAGANMANAGQSFDYLPYFYSDLFDLGFEAVGELDSRMTTFADWKEQYREGVVYYLAEGVVTGVLLWNVWEQLDAARTIIALKKKYTNESELRGTLPVST